MLVSVCVYVYVFLVSLTGQLYHCSYSFFLYAYSTQRLRIRKGSRVSPSPLPSQILLLPSSVAMFFQEHYILACLGLWVLYKVLQAVYYVSPLHPLSGIPGPKLAAATYLPEFWYDVVKYGCYTKEIARLHRVYGKLESLRRQADGRRCYCEILELGWGLFYLRIT